MCYFLLSSAVESSILYQHLVLKRRRRVSPAKTIFLIIDLQVKPFQTRYNLFNFAPYTKSHCDCDEAFYNCLKAANTSKADAVGDVFFNVLGIQCVEEKLGRGCPQNYNAETREENPESRSLILPGLAVRITKSPSPQSGVDCANPRLFVINTKRKY